MLPYLKLNFGKTNRTLAVFIKIPLFFAWNIFSCYSKDLPRGFLIWALIPILWVSNVTKLSAFLQIIAFLLFAPLKTSKRQI